MTEATGSIPQSTALTEAGSGEANLAELLSRDPEGYQQQDLDQVVRALREQRQRIQEAEAAAGSKPRTAKAGAKQLLSGTPASTEDLGL